jgi:menaquinone-dependent protoporphyrinogen oxidase
MSNIQEMGTKKILIAYATKGGVTEESALIISNVLKEKYGFEIDTINLKKNPSPDLAQYSNIIIGSGIRMGRWYKHALKLLENDFQNKKVAIFLSSGEGGEPDKHEQAINKYIKNVLAKYPHVKPVAAEAFGGRMKIMGKTITDNYDTEKVKAWAEELGKKLAG